MPQNAGANKVDRFRDCIDMTGPPNRVLVKTTGKLVPTVLRGNAVLDAPRRTSRRGAAERRNAHSHAELGNEYPAALLYCLVFGPGKLLECDRTRALRAELRA